MSSLQRAARIHRRLQRRRPHAAPLQSSSRCTSSSDASTNKAADDAITVDGAAAKKEALNAQCLQPRPIFPWRSSPIPLDRLKMPSKPQLKSGDSEEDEVENHARLESYYGSDYFSKGGPLGPGWASPMEPWFRGCLYLCSMNMLGVSWPASLFPWTRKEWEREMEWNFCIAFSYGVRGMIEDTYILPEDDASEGGDEGQEDAYDVHLNVTLDPLPLIEDGEETTSSAASSKSEDLSDNKSTKKDEIREEHHMLERNLRQLYQSARKHSHPSKVNIVLRTVPQSATIESMFPAFGLSRKLVEDHPNLRHTYRNVMERLKQKHKDAVVEKGKKSLGPVEVGHFLLQSLQEIMERSAKLSGDGTGALTIVAQVSINCKEVFCVQDVESGEIIQGWENAQPRDVTHLVRFEMVVNERWIGREKGDGYEMELGRWQITDWDDLLDGNVFFT
ncbi:hypothetical protein ACHAXT_011686 [Thalassiosira profunda]